MSAPKEVIKMYAVVITYDDEGTIDVPCIMEGSLHNKKSKAKADKKAFEYLHPRDRYVVAEVYFK